MDYFLTIIKDQAANLTTIGMINGWEILKPFDGSAVIKKVVSFEEGLQIMSELKGADNPDDLTLNISARLLDGQIVELCADDDFLAPVRYADLRVEEMTDEEITKLRSLYFTSPTDGASRHN